MNLGFNADDYIKSKRYRLVNAVLLYEDGKITLERYYNNRTPENRNQIKSIWKSILSLTLGICLEKGYINSIDDPIFRYLPVFDGNIHVHHRFITIRHLLTMSSGIYWNGGVHYHCPMLEQMERSKNWVNYIADIPISDYPGTKFTYKEWDVILLSAVIGNPYEIFYEYLFKPLGITGGVWTRSSCGVDYPSWGGDTTSDLSARDLLKIGLLMLDGGQGLISPDYINQSIVPSPAYEGYGFLWWLSEKGYHGRGFGGQELNIYPQIKSVAAVQATVTPSSKSYNDICEALLF